jgi:hypothetical protein
MYDDQYGFFYWILARPKLKVCISWRFPNIRNVLRPLSIFYIYLGGFRTLDPRRTSDKLVQTRDLTA